MIQTVLESATPRDRLQLFVDKMRASVPFGDVPWDSPVWDITDVLPRAGRRLHHPTRNRFWFGEHRKSRSEVHKPFAYPFSDFAKAILCARHCRSAQVPAAHLVSLRAMRYLYEALGATNSHNPSRLELAHFRVAEAAVLKREKISSAYRVGQRLEEIATLIDHHCLTPVKLDYCSSIPKSAVEALATKMPTPEALKALGDASASDSLYDPTGNLILLILMRVVDILAATGMRIGEVLTLPEYPLVRRDDEVGLRYWPEKGGEARVKPLSAVHVELVERAVKDLSAACAEARNVAKWCEQNVGIAPLPDGLPQMLSSADIENLGLSVSGLQWLRQHGVPTIPYSAGGTRCIRARLNDVAQAIVKMYDTRPVVATSYGGAQTLGNSLIVVFKNENHSDRSTNRFVPTPVTWGKVSLFLGGRKALGHESIFERLNLRDKDGNHYRLTSHQFRHWLSTMAKRGGLSEVELARWMGRKRIADNRAYDHRSMEERTEEARELIRKGGAHGPIADVYHSLPPVQAEAFLEAQVNGTLTTPYGLCVHDYGQGPCERHFSCAGCSELLRRKGDAGERAALGTWLTNTRISLQTAKAEADEATYGASNWVKYNERLEIDLITMLAVDDNEGATGELIKVWQGGHGPKDNPDA